MRLFFYFCMGFIIMRVFENDGLRNICLKVYGMDGRVFLWVGRSEVFVVVLWVGI